MEQPYEPASGATCLNKKKTTRLLGDKKCYKTFFFF
jgi:hypothetical protein